MNLVFAPEPPPPTHLVDVRSGRVRLTMTSMDGLRWGWVVACGRRTRLRGKAEGTLDEVRAQVRLYSDMLPWPSDGRALERLTAERKER